MDQYIGRELDQDSRKPSRIRATQDTSWSLTWYYKLTILSSGEQEPRRLNPGFRTFAIRQIRLFVFVGHDSTSSTQSAMLCMSHRRIPSCEHDQIHLAKMSKAATLSEEQSQLLKTELPYTTAVIKKSSPPISRPQPQAGKGNQQPASRTISTPICPTERGHDDMDNTHRAAPDRPNTGTTPTNFSLNIGSPNPSP